MLIRRLHLRGYLKGSGSLSPALEMIWVEPGGRERGVYKMRRGWLSINIQLVPSCGNQQRCVHFRLLIEDLIKRLSGIVKHVDRCGKPDLFLKNDR